MRCEHCGAECALPFTCQHCGGKFCPDCRLPPGHGCTGMQSWNRRPAPGVGMNYRKSGEIIATGGFGGGTRTGEKDRPTIPWLKVMIAGIVIILLGIAFLVLSSPVR